VAGAVQPVVLHVIGVDGTTGQESRVLYANHASPENAHAYSLQPVGSSLTKIVSCLDALRSSAARAGAARLGRRRPPGPAPGSVTEGGSGLVTDPRPQRDRALQFGAADE
jgi:hypothetical protein